MSQYPLPTGQVIRLAESVQMGALSPIPGALRFRFDQPISKLYVGISRVTGDASATFVVRQDFDGPGTLDWQLATVDMGDVVEIDTTTLHYGGCGQFSIYPIGPISESVAPLRYHISVAGVRA